MLNKNLEVEQELQDLMESGWVLFFAAFFCTKKNNLKLLTVNRFTKKFCSEFETIFVIIPCFALGA